MSAPEVESVEQERLDQEDVVEPTPRVKPEKPVTVSVTPEEPPTVPLEWTFPGSHESSSFRPVLCPVSSTHLGRVV